MNIQFNSIRYKNILSTGNVFTDIPLNKNRTTLVSGTNGSGKSTILDAITFALYGKPFRKINKPQLINTINTKDLVVEVNFTVSGNDYLIRRGMKPNIFEIYRNGELVNQDAAVRDYQAYLEQNILGLNYKSFNQIVVLGSATYVPFMELPAYQRREIIEDLLDIQVFSTMNLLLKDRVSLNKESITDNNYQIDLIKSKIESAVEHNESIRKIREGEVNKIRERMQDHIDRIEEEKTFIEEIEVTIKALIDSIEDKPVIKKKLEKTKNIRQELDTVLRGYLKDLNFYHDNDNCPTCKQGIDHNFKETIVYERNQKKREAEDGMDGIEIKITELEARIEEISKVEDVIQSHNLKIGEHRAQIKMSMNALKSFKNDLDAAEKEVEEVDTSKLEEFNKTLKDLQNDQVKLFDERETLGVAAAMLKDGGIKTRIIRQYIPVMNKLINKYLSAFELFVDFHLDENFNEVIKSRFRDAFSYASFSEGEKLRISLSIMLSWRAVAKLRNSVSTNLLILDETLDGAMDGAGVENLIDTLHNLNNNDNIFVISHRGDQFGEKFDSNIRFEKVKNFSQIAA
jgi:DNA repair exonuclease SbcCD ATPase subunit